MPEHASVVALIDRIVAGARIPSRAERDDLRRELEAHFEDAGTSEEAAREAIRRFGEERVVAGALRRVYRWDYRLLYVAKIAACLAASIGVAFFIEAAANLRVGREHDSLALAPGFAHAIVRATALVLAFVVAREALKPPLAWRRVTLGLCVYVCVCGVVELTFANGAVAFVIAATFVALGALGSMRHRAPARWLLIYGSFVAVTAATHVNIAFGPMRTLLASAVTLTIWASTSAVAARADRLFVNLLESAG